MKCEYLNICKFYSADTCNGDSFHCVNDDVKQLRKKESSRTKGSASSAEPAGRESVNVPKIFGKSRLKTISERSFFINFTSVFSFLFFLFLGYGAAVSVFTAIFVNIFLRISNVISKWFRVLLDLVAQHKEV